METALSSCRSALSPVTPRSVEPPSGEWVGLGLLLVTLGLFDNLRCVGLRFRGGFKVKSLLKWWFRGIFCALVSGNGGEY